MAYEQTTGRTVFSTPAQNRTYQRNAQSRSGYTPTRWAKGGIMNSPLNTGGKRQPAPGFPGGGGGGGAGGWGARDVAYQEALREDIWKKTTPDVKGVGFMTKWRQKEDGTWEYTAELGEEEQSIYDDAFTRQKMFLDEATALGSGGWEQAQQSRFDQKRALYAESDARAQQERLAREQATGASSTGMFLGARNEQSLLNQRNMELEEAAFRESQQLIDSALTRGRNDVTMMGEVGDWANQYLKIPSSDPKGNLQNVSDAFTRQMDQEAAAAAAKKKGKNKFWGIVLVGASDAKVICTAMNDDYGFGAYRNAIWLKYSELNYKDKPEIEKGYHALCLPMLRIRKKWYGKPTYAWLKHVVKHRTADLKAEMYGKKRDRIGQAWRFVLEPLCYLVGKRLIRR